MPNVKPLTDEEARVLMSYRDGYSVPISEGKNLIELRTFYLAIQLACDEFLRLSGGLTRAGALALAAYEDAKKL